MQSNHKCDRWSLNTVNICTSLWKIKVSQRQGKTFYLLSLLNTWLQTKKVTLCKDKNEEEKNIAKKDFKLFSVQIFIVKEGNRSEEAIVNTGFVEEKLLHFCIGLPERKVLVLC